MRRIGAHSDTVAAFAQPAHHPVGGGEAVGAAAGEQHGVRLLHEVARFEDVGLPGPRRTAPDVDGGLAPSGTSTTVDPVAHRASNRS
ncbi:hypothetical protein GCM10025787_19570 [Saccharopolyspora rosea]